MLRGEWRLDYSGTSFSFGGWDPVANPFRLPTAIGLRSAPSMGDVTLTTDDADRPRTDGQLFGADVRGGRTVGFSLALRGSSEAATLALLATASAAWRADSIRWTPGAYATLTTNSDGRLRTLFGRPRRFAPNDDNRKTGLVTVECDFQAMDDRFYADAETGISVPFIAPPSSGVVAPVTTPVTTTPQASTPGGIVIGGDLETCPVITINGPILNPTVAAVNRWSLQLMMQIVAGQSVTIDTRPWVRAVTSSSGASFAGALTRTSRLDRAVLSPGAYAVSLSGVDNTGLSSMQFAWRDSYSSL